MNTKSLPFFFAVGFLLFGAVFTTQAASLIFVSDTISTSRPGVGADHTIRFTATNLVPVSGKIVITPQAGAFTVPSGLDYTDTDLIIEGVQNSLGLVPAGGQSGVAVEGGVAPRIIITLSSNTFIPPASNVIVKIGKNAAHEIIGDQQMVNPSAVGSYKIAVETRNSLDAPLDTAFGMIAITNPVSVGTGVAQAAASATFSFTAGGSTTLTNTNNTQVVFSFPQDFYTEDLKLEAKSYANNFFATSKPALSGKSFAGKVYDFNLFAASGSVVSATSKPIIIVFSYTDADISGLDESTIAPYRFGISDSAWQLIPGGTVDTANNKVTFSTTLFGSFALFASPAPPPAPPPAPSGGGGGGIGPIEPPVTTQVIFTGRAYPLSKVVVLKDGQIAVSTIAGPDSRFEISLTGLTTGNYTFAVYGEDNKGIRSSLFTFPSYITSGATTNVSGIFIAPSIAVDKSEVKRGENIAIFGQSVPRAEITIAVSSKEDFFVKTMADKDGAYLHNFDTTSLSINQHFTKSKAALDGEISSFSKTVSFLVSTKTIFVEPAECPAKADLNNDCQVNLVDFSIAAYWYKRPLSAAFKAVEGERLNGDGKIDLTDFSIMAFYWTG